MTDQGLDRLRLALIELEYFLLLTRLGERLGWQLWPVEFN